MQLEPRLIDVAVPAQPRGIVLVLHGGDTRDDPVVSPTQPSVMRMVPVALSIRWAARGQLAIFRVLNSERGWGERQGRVADAIWAIERARERVGNELPVALVGHSLGGRAALMAADQPMVHSVVALAPWVKETDLVRISQGTRVLIIHGTKDRVADPEHARRLAARLRQHAEVSYVSVRGGSHAMLAHRRKFDGLAARFVALTLLGRSGGATIGRIEHGERELQI